MYIQCEVQEEEKEKTEEEEEEAEGASAGHASWTVPNATKSWEACVSPKRQETSDVINNQNRAKRHPWLLY